MIWLFLTSGLFLGWSLGANDGVNIFGGAVVSRMVKFKVAATIAGIFVILGAVISGAGTTRTLTDLGSVNALAGSFTVAFSAGLAIAWLTKLKLPVSTSQAVVGSIVGWNLFTGSPTDINALTKIISVWIICPLLAAVITFGLYKITTFIINRIKLHILRIDAYTRIGMLVVGAFGSYSLGANNIANVMGMFISSSPFVDIHLADFFTISGTQQLFFIGGLAIAVGIFTNSYRVMITVGKDLFKITPVAGLLVMLSHSLVLFLFASEALEALLIANGLPSIPLVPVSSTQAVIGAVIGVGLAKSGRTINFKVLGKISIGWVTAPIAACVISLVALFFVQNVFEQKVVQSVSYRVSSGIIKKLEQQNIPSAPLENLVDQNYIGSAHFRHELNKNFKWSEQQLFQIFSYSELDTFIIDSTLAKNVFEHEEILLERLDALKQLHGKMYFHKWQLEDDLIEKSNSWKIQTEKGSGPYNKKLKQDKQLVFDTFRLKTKISD